MMPKNENILLDVQLIELELANLLQDFPDLADDEDLRADMVEGSTAAYDVLDRILTKFREAEADATAIGERLNRLSARQNAADKRGQAMRRLALRLMTAGDLKSVKLPEGTLSRVKGRESVAVVDESQLPEWAFTVKVDKRASKSAIKNALDAGIAVPGAERVVGEETLQVR
jgi:hypothetical protein